MQSLFGGEETENLSRLGASTRNSIPASLAALEHSQTNEHTKKKPPKKKKILVYLFVSERSKARWGQDRGERREAHRLSLELPATSVGRKKAQ
jgi:hypothetical protein